jgi:GntR family transcriptional regulator/GntR family frlABCD operon transcriptional regulator
VEPKQPQHQRIREALKQQIQRGDFPQGSQLPSENDLSARFGTTRMTVRQALGELVREGFIERQHGKGSFVKSERQALGLLSFRGFSDVVGETPHAVRTEFLREPHRADWPQPFFYLLTAEETAGGCLVLERLRLAGEDPVMLETSFLPAPGLDDLLTDGLLDGSLFKTLSVRHHLGIRDLDQTIRAVTATPEQARIFGCRKSTPLVYVERRYATTRTGFFVYSQLHCFTEKYALGSMV